jgi:hypothetical protein
MPFFKCQCAASMGRPIIIIFSYMQPAQHHWHYACNHGCCTGCLFYIDIASMSHPISNGFRLALALNKFHILQL